jgi:hypothetical protein
MDSGHGRSTIIERCLAAMAGGPVRTDDQSANPHPEPSRMLLILILAVLLSVLIAGAAAVQSEPDGLRRPAFLDA